MRQTKSILTNYLTKEKSSVEDSGLFNPGHACILSSALSWNKFVSFQENIRSCLSQWMAFLKCSVIYRENRAKRRCCYKVLDENEHEQHSKNSIHQDLTVCIWCTNLHFTFSGQSNDPDQSPSTLYSFPNETKIRKGVRSGPVSKPEYLFHLAAKKAMYFLATMGITASNIPHFDPTTIAWRGWEAGAAECFSKWRTK